MKKEELPNIIPVFPLSNFIIFPKTTVPLNIFEPRYLAMVTHALSTPSRLIGMVQPLGENTQTDASGNPLLFETGCAGRLSFFQESDNGRFAIALTGLCRFNRRGQQLDPNGFLVADVDWHPFAHDLRIDVSAFDRGPLIQVMRRYFDLKGFETDWTQIENSDNDQLLATLSMVCPFEIAEKQALLEADTMAKRAELLIAMMEMALHNETGGNDARH